MTRSDIRVAVESLLLCIGHGLGCEASIHALNEIYEEDTTEVISLHASLMALID